MCENGGTFVNLFHIDTHSLASDGLELREAKGTSSYPGWIKSPHVVTLGVLKISDLDSLTIFIGGVFRS